MIDPSDPTRDPSDVSGNSRRFRRIDGQQRTNDRICWQDLACSRLERDVPDSLRSSCINQPITGEIAVCHHYRNITAIRYNLRAIKKTDVQVVEFCNRETFIRSKNSGVQGLNVGIDRGTTVCNQRRHVASNLSITKHPSIGRIKGDVLVRTQYCAGLNGTGNIEAAVVDSHRDVTRFRGES